MKTILILLAWTLVGLPGGVRAQDAAPHAIDIPPWFANTFLDFREDVVNGIIKSIVFGAVVTWIAVFQGYDCEPTSEGISEATTKTVVYGSLSVLGLDFILTAVMFGGF